jgi:hypothetical protein
MDPVADLLGLIPAHLFAYIAYAVAACAVLDANLPQPPAGSRWVLPRKALHMVAQNYRYARNAVIAGGK